MSSINSFLSKFTQWVDKTSVLPKSSRNKLAPSFRKAILTELPKRDDWRTVQLRSFDNILRLQIDYRQDIQWVVSNHKDKLVVAAPIPAWRGTWKAVSKDVHVESIIDDFFHFASQYIARSALTETIGAIALVYNKSYDYRTASLTHSSSFRSTDLQENLRLAIGCNNKQLPVSSNKQREFVAWLRAINGLDPYINRAIYQYWRATSLSEYDFSVDAITALDNVSSIAAEFTSNRLGIHSGNRSMLGDIFNFTKYDQKLLAKLYELRCTFGAHPSSTKWWDFNEIYDDELNQFYYLIKRLLWGLCQAEQSSRVVEPNPSSWSDWFMIHSEMLLESIWFTKIS